jgi:transposase
MISQLHQLLPGLIPGGAKKALSAAQARQLLAGVRPRDAAGKARRRVAAELIGDLERTCQRKKAADKELRDLLTDIGTTLTSLNGIGPSGAARLLTEAGDITRFPSKAHFASWNGTAPIDASSGDQVRHRLSRASNRQLAASGQAGRSWPGPRKPDGRWPTGSPASTSTGHRRAERSPGCCGSGRG